MDRLSALFAKNRHLLGEAFELDRNGNLHVKDAGKSGALDEMFRDFFVESMRGILGELVFDNRKRKKRSITSPEDDEPDVHNFGWTGPMGGRTAVPPVTVPHAAPAAPS